MDNIYAIPILQGLRSNTYLKSLKIAGFGNFAVAGSPAIQQLLESTTSIQHFEIAFATFRGDEFRLVAQGLIHSGTICKLKFTFCRFQEEDQFRSILQNKQNLTDLCLDRCTFIGGNIHGTDILLSTLSRPDSQLRSFELMEISLDRALSNGQFRNLLRAVEKSKLDRFVIGILETQQQLRTLTQSIPLMRIKELQVVVASSFRARNVKQDLLLAVMNNFSLRVVKGNRLHSSHVRLGAEIFDEDDKRTLVFCADRNKRLDQWVENPETVDRKVWPNALKLAEQAGPNSLFHGLRSVLGGDSTGLRVGRKRKRPQYYAPS